MKSIIHPISLASLLFLLHAFLGSTFASSAQLSLGIGDGDDGSLIVLRFTPDKTLWDRTFDNGWTLTTRIEGSISTLEGSGLEGGKSVLVGVTPFFTLAPAHSSIYAEFGIGVHYFDRKRVNHSKEMGTHFQFGDTVGLGFRLGRSGVNLGYRFVHFSNAGISTRNPGLDFHLITVSANY